MCYYVQLLLQDVCWPPDLGFGAGPHLTLIIDWNVSAQTVCIACAAILWRYAMLQALEPQPKNSFGNLWEKVSGLLLLECQHKVSQLHATNWYQKDSKSISFLQGFWFKARPKNLTVPDRNQSWFSFGAWLRFQCLNLLMMMTFLAAKLGTSRLAGSSVLLTTATC